MSCAVATPSPSVGVPLLLMRTRLVALLCVLEPISVSTGLHFLCWFLSASSSLSSAAILSILSFAMSRLPSIRFSAVSFGLETFVSGGLGGRSWCRLLLRLRLVFRDDGMDAYAGDSLSFPAVPEPGLESVALVDFDRCMAAAALPLKSVASGVSGSPLLSVRRVTDCADVRDGADRSSRLATDSRLKALLTDGYGRRSRLRFNSGTRSTLDKDADRSFAGSSTSGTAEDERWGAMSFFSRRSDDDTPSRSFVRRRVLLGLCAAEEDRCGLLLPLPSPS